MAYEKLYNELYALVSLKYFWTGYHSGFVKSESPDWVNEAAGVGLEVSQALLPADGVTESFLEQYLGCLREELPPVAFTRYGNRLYFYNNRLWAVLDESPAQPADFAPKILYRFSRKLEKLNSNYRVMPRNCLYLYAHSDGESENALQSILTEMQRRQNGLPVRFSLIFVEFDQHLYVLDLSNEKLEIIPIPEKARGFLNAEAEYLRHAASWENGSAFDILA